MSTVEGARTLAAEIARRESALDILVNNAGAAWGESFETFPEKGWDKVTLLSEDSWGEKKPSLAAEEIAALTGLAQVEGALTVRQVALQDIDGDAAADKLVSVFQINPKDSERFSFSGVFVQYASAPGSWVLVESNKNDTLSFTVRAALDLDGDRSHELWINSVSTDGGGGDRIYQVTRTPATGLG